MSATITLSHQQPDRQKCWTLEELRERANEWIAIEDELAGEDDVLGFLNWLGATHG